MPYASDEKIDRLAETYKRLGEVTEEECYVGGRNCGNCKFHLSSDGWGEGRPSLCTAPTAKKEVKQHV